MPDFIIISVKEAQLRTISGRKRTFINEYVDYIQQLPKSQAGKLTIGEGEKHATIRRHLATTAKALNIPLIIKRSGNDLYFWKEGREAERPSSKRRYTRRNRRQEETAEQYFSETGELAQEQTEDSPESGQVS